MVSNKGRVKSVDRSYFAVSRCGLKYKRKLKGQILSTSVCSNGYVLVHLGTKRTTTVHALVARAFKGPRPAKYDVAHQDGNKINNIPSNLKYKTRTDNNYDHRRLGRTKLSAEAIHFILLHKKKYGIGAHLARRFGVSKTTISRIFSQRENF